MTHTEILFRFLKPRACRLVRQVEFEWHMYTNPSHKAETGCLKRDELRNRLTNLAYARYAETLQTIIPLNP